MQMLASLLAIVLGLHALTSDSVPAKSLRKGSASTSIGAIAIESDSDGLLYVDGKNQSAISAKQVTVIKLMPGQHIMELRGREGESLWKQIVTIPKGEQIVQTVNARKPPPQPSKPPSLKRFEDYGVRDIQPELALLDRFAVSDTQEEPKTEHLCHSATRSPFFYGLGRYEDALHAANDDIRCQEGNRPTNPSDTLKTARELMELYSTRARIAFALSNYSSVLSDLDSALGQVSEYRNILAKMKEPSQSAPSNANGNAVQEKATKNIEQILRLCRALSLMKLQRFDEAMEEVNAAAADPVVPIIRSNIESAKLSAASLQHK